MKKLYLLFLLNLITHSVYCQLPEINFERISVQQGLQNNSIYNITQDRTGFIWIGGEHGLYRYDGYELTFFKNLPGRPPLKSVYSIREDSVGLWILSNTGIWLYNTQTEKSILMVSFLSTPPNWNYMTNPAMMRDSKGNIWVSAFRGLIKISRQENAKIKLTNEAIFNQGIQDAYKIKVIKFLYQEHSENSVGALYEDHAGNIWAGCVEGLYVLRPDSHNFLRLDSGANRGSMNPIKYVNSIIEFDNNEYWIATYDGFYLLTNVKSAFRDSIPDNSILHFSLNKTHKGLLAFLATNPKNFLLGSDNGIFKIKKDPITGKVNFESLNDGPLPAEEIGTSNSSQFIFEDRSGVLWAGGSNNGISKSNLIQSQFTSYNGLAKQHFNSSDINPILKDSRNNLWVGCWGGGINRIQPGNNKVTRFNFPFLKNDVVCMKEVSKGIFWIGTFKGLIEFNTGNGKTTDPLPNNEIANDLRNTFIWDILSDGDHVYIAATSGLFIYNLINKQLYKYSNDSYHYIDNYFDSRSLFKSRNGEIWVGTGISGINKISFNSESGIVSAFPIVTPGLLNRHGIDISAHQRIYEDNNGLLWITNATGLHSINLKTSEVKSYKLFENIDFPEVWSIIEDDHNNLWLGTHYGLCRFNLITKVVTVFNKSNGLPILIHGQNSVYKDDNGRMYFGGLGGFYSFHPDSLKTNQIKPLIVITDFRLFYKSIKPDTTKNSILKRDISYTSLIELSHNQNDISFQFAALDYNHPLKNKYAYKLEGYQNGWIETDANNRIATYTNLDPGTYTFRVKGSNNDGVWNEEGASIKIIIHKPWYSTMFAWFIYIIVFVEAIVGLIKRKLRKLGKEKLLLENQVGERTLQIEKQKEEIRSQRDLLEEQNQKIIALDELKSRFFTNVSHEFRTPLSLIQSPVEELLDDPRRNVKERHKLNLVHRNTQKLLNLVNQLLDISKIDGSKMKLNLVHADVMIHLGIVAGSFSSFAETKSIHYRLKFPKESFIEFFDPDKLEKIAVNLLSNAFKFTPEGGEINFTAHYISGSDPGNPNFLEFSVIDSGTGIPSDSLEKIFDRFYQVESSLKKEGAGTGIGLSLARDMARLMHGDITGESKEGKGSTFRVHIPLGKDHLKESEFIISNELPVPVPYAGMNGITDDRMPEQNRISSNVLPVLLVVEDNRDIRLHLYDNFNIDYLIYEAIDGISGFKKAAELIPDLIITDLMMPRMDGIELCEKLKNDERTSHIPIIMLTAKVTLEDKISGLQKGADDYISKPFNMAELKAKVRNLIELRKNLRERFAREITIEPMNISITPIDEKFLKRAIEIVENHINDEKFDLNELRTEMNMSRSTLFRKLQALTGQSPSEFIRIIRLKRAANLLKQNFGNVSQVSLEVGFNNISYFNRTFKKLFGLSPIEYTKNNLKSST